MTCPMAWFLGAVLLGAPHFAGVAAQRCAANFCVRAGFDAALRVFRASRFLAKNAL